jgi:non-ribosomal peptide synthetase component E (peptide arylation enzyme)
MPDKHLGERACAFLIPLPGQTLPNVAELGTFLSSVGLAKYKLPERIESIPEFPLTRVGKVDKAALRAQIAELITAEQQRLEGKPQHA